MVLYGDGGWLVHNSSFCTRNDLYDHFIVVCVFPEIGTSRVSIPYVHYVHRRFLSLAEVFFDRGGMGW